MSVSVEPATFVPLEVALDSGRSDRAIFQGELLFTILYKVACVAELCICIRDNSFLVTCALFRHNVGLALNAVQCVCYVVANLLTD